MILMYGYADEMIGERFGENKKSAESEAGRMLLATLLAENGIDATLDNIKRKENGNKQNVYQSTHFLTPLSAAMIMAIQEDPKTIPEISNGIQPQ